MATQTKSTKLTPEQARAYLADPDAFFPDDELCLVCGAERDWDDVEYNGRMFCGARCRTLYARILRLADQAEASAVEQHQKENA